MRVICAEVLVIVYTHSFVLKIAFLVVCRIQESLRLQLRGALKSCVNSFIAHKL